MPGQFERERILARYLAPYGMSGTALAAFAEACDGAAPALMRQLCENFKRQIVIGPKVGWPMTKTAALERLLATVQPHPDLGKPRLWSLGLNDPALRMLPWPLPLAADVAPAEPAEELEPSVVNFPGRR